MIRITKRMGMHGTKTSSLSAAGSRFINECEKPKKTVCLPLLRLNVSLVINVLSTGPGALPTTSGVQMRH